MSKPPEATGSSPSHLQSVGAGPSFQVPRESGLKPAIDEFRRSVEITRDVRFNASTRLARRQLFTAYIVSLLSLYVIALSLLPNILDLTYAQNQILLASSIVLSVFIIFSSLIDGAQNYFYRGEMLRICGRKLSRIYIELKSLDPMQQPDGARNKFEELFVQYHTALDECPFNHDPIDYARQRLNKPYLFETISKATVGHRLKLRVGIVLASVGWLTPYVLAILAISIVVYLFVLRGSSLAGPLQTLIEATPS